MKTSPDDYQESELTLRDLYPQLSEEELSTLGEIFDQYLGIVLRQYARIYNDPEALTELAGLTNDELNARMKDERSTKE